MNPFQEELSLINCMQTPLFAPPGDESILDTDTLAVRRLMLAVLHRAIMDLLGDDKCQKESALQWFKRKKPEHKVQLMIHYGDVKEKFLKESRIKKIEKLIEGLPQDAISKSRRKHSTY